MAEDMQMDTQESTSFHDIACESCRRVKKCKCDRILPICSQCRASGTVCKYSEKGKTGQPSGYAANLERRLAETEAALFLSMSRENNSYQQQPDAMAVFRHFQSHSGGQRKADKGTEWTRYRLLTDAGRQDWWYERQRLVSGRDGREADEAVLRDNQTAQQAPSPGYVGTADPSSAPPWLNVAVAQNGRSANIDQLLNKDIEDGQRTAS